MKHIRKFSTFNENKTDGFVVAAKDLIDGTKMYKNDYSEKRYNQIIELEKLIYGNEEDRKKFVKSIKRLLGISEWDLPNELYKYL
jgi:hypothetical protein